MSMRSTSRLRLAGLLALLAWIYVHRIGFAPPYWEEARRCIIAFEMIARGDYVAPTVLGEPYGRKPPLQNWLIVLGSGFDLERVDAVVVRWVSVLSMFGIALLLWALARRPGTRWPWLPAAVFLTLGISVQYGRSGEIDPLFTLWTTAAFSFYVLGARRGSAWLRWVPSQLMVALGVLTKGLSPVFFYPVVLIHVALERRRRPAATPGRLAPVLVGLAMAVAVVAAWLVPYALSGSMTALATSGDEILARSPLGGGLARTARGLAVFPFESLGSLLPWSLFVLALASRRIREAVRRAVRDDPYLRFSLVVVGWSFLVLWVMPGAKTRYLMPAFPFFAAALAVLVERVRSAMPAAGGEGGVPGSVAGTVSGAVSGNVPGDPPGTIVSGGASSTPGAALGSAARTPSGSARGRMWLRALVPTVAAAWVLAAYLASKRTPDVEMAPAVVVGLFALGLFAIRPGGGLPPLPVRAALVAGVLYAAAFVAFAGPRAAADLRRLPSATGELARRLRADAAPRGWDIAAIPIVCDSAIPNRGCFAAMKVLGRPLARPPLPRRGYVLSDGRRPLPEGAVVLAHAGGYVLWAVDGTATAATPAPAPLPPRPPPPGG